MNKLRFKKKAKTAVSIYTLPLLTIFSLCLSSCAAPSAVEDITGGTVNTFEEVSDDLGQERRINEDVLIAPEQEEKIQIRF